MTALNNWQGAKNIMINHVNRSTIKTKRKKNCLILRMKISIMHAEFAKDHLAMQFMEFIMVFNAHL